MGTNETNMYGYAMDKVYIKNIYNITLILIIYEILRIWLEYNIKVIT